MKKPVTPDRSSSESGALSSDADLIKMIAAAMDDMRKDEKATDPVAGVRKWKTWRAS